MPRAINHAELRTQFHTSVCRLMNQLKRFSSYVLKVDELMGLGVHVSEFDPFELNEAIIFQPLAEQELHDYVIDEIMLQNDDIVKKLDLPDWTPPEASKVVSRLDEERAALKAAEEAYEYLEAMYSCLSKSYEPKNPLSMARNWTDIPIPHPEFTWPRELGFNSWPRDTGLLNHNSLEHVGWRYQIVSEWKDTPRRGDPKARPHVRIVVCHGAIGTPNGILLGEIGAIAQAIYNRLNQPSFENESYFPV
ncbi:hypothetical protein PENSUB_2073 [Penicillium subrubescens]|uniref:Uncharacterized protein n=2 Tax=Penicillium subrubescens TaxID=1316194 RepID=A0A1Q5UIM8_9EURO|nr:hypothetical protein PENSUB_2073 [Penicillium subrubescens]